MRRVIYWICMGGALLWTLGVLASCVVGVVAVSETEGDKDVAAAVTGAGFILNFVIWAAVVIPLGIFGMLVKPGDKVIVQTGERRK